MALPAWMTDWAAPNALRTLGPVVNRLPVSHARPMPVSQARNYANVAWREGSEYVASLGNMTLSYLKGHEIVLGNGTGSCMGVQITQPSSASVGVNAIQIPFRGTVFGIRMALAWTISGSGFSPTAPIGIDIDGVDYTPVAHNPADWATGELTASYFAKDPYYAGIIAEDLPEGYHVATLYLPHPVNSGSSNVWVIFGFILDKAAGYQDEIRQGFLGPVPGGPSAMPTSLTTPAWGTTGDNKNPTWVRRHYYINTDSASHTVSIALNSVTIWGPVTIAAGGYAEWDPGERVSTNASTSTGIKHISDSALVKFGFIAGFGN